jgi:fatty acid desaturase
MLANSNTDTRAINAAGAKIEWPTLALFTTVYSLFGALTWWHAALPWWLILPLGGYLVCLYGSLQHEAVHGHPTPWPLVNEALVFPSLWLWMSFRVYRDSHLAHHHNETLTDPRDDPESYYVSPQAWARMGRLKRGFLRANNTFLVRLVVGPVVAVWQHWSDEIRRLSRGDRSHLASWGLHLIGCLIVMAWVIGVCRIPFWEYVLLYAYPGLALTLIRSFLEHRAHPVAEERSVIVEAGPALSLLFLNNNLHALHHAHPGVSWYRLPALYRARRDELLALNGGYRYGGYLEVARRYFLRPKEPVLHPYAN